jgi:hypothetical protein
MLASQAVLQSRSCSVTSITEMCDEVTHDSREGLDITETGHRMVSQAQVSSMVQTTNDIQIIVGRRTMRFDLPECEAFIRELDVQESRDFLIGLGNGLWLSALITIGGAWIVQIALG